MAKQVITVCDLKDDSCAGAVNAYRLWREGERQAAALDLCVHHATPLEALMERASTVDLPVKPRVTMHVTKLRTTDATRHLKKE